MPEFMSSSEGSFCGMSEKLGSRRCPFDSKNERNISLSSLSPKAFIITSQDKYPYSIIINIQIKIVKRGRKN